MKEQEVKYAKRAFELSVEWAKNTLKKGLIAAKKEHKIEDFDELLDFVDNSMYDIYVEVTERF